MKNDSLQMSDTLTIASMLSVSGGFQDAYTYLLRGNVFANAQTGNVVLMAVSGLEGDFALAARYLMTLLAFSLGIFVSETVRRHFGNACGRLHWRQPVLIAEALLLAAAAFIPKRMDMTANMLISFVCAMQVQAFRTFRGRAYASTMCIGNIRSCMALFCAFVHTRDREELVQSAEYLLIIFMFAAGCAAGGLVSQRFGRMSIMFSSVVLMLSCLLMSVSKDNTGQRL